MCWTLSLFMYWTLSLFVCWTRWTLRYVKYAAKHVPSSGMNLKKRIKKLIKDFKKICIRRNDLYILLLLCLYNKILKHFFTLCISLYMFIFLCMFVVNTLLHNSFSNMYLSRDNSSAINVNRDTRSYAKPMGTILNL